MIETVKTYALLVLAGLVVALSLSTCEYRRQLKATKVEFKAAEFALDTQNEAIQRQNAEADKQWKAANASLLAQQKTIDQRALAQEKSDEATKLELARLAAANRGQPVRVRVVAGTCRPSGDRGVPKAGAAPSAGPGNTDSPTGLLDPAAAQLVAGDANAIEQLQAAFNGCKGK